jgi:poly(3-hydroxybutyrate) depolymerase
MLSIRSTTCLLAVALAPAFTQDKPPSAKQIEAWVQSYIELDPKTAAGRVSQLELLGQLASVPEPSKAELATWLKRFERMQGKLRTLEKKSGRYHWWEEDKRGFYIVSGETKRPKGLFIGLHGGGVGSGDAQPSADSYGPAVSKLDWVGIYPEVLEKTERGWTDSGTEEWVLDLIDAAVRTWDIDPDRVFIGGHSMGGYGTWVLGAHHADRVAGLCASAGAPTPLLDSNDKVIGIMDGVVPNLRNVPLVVWQSVDDPQVPPDANQAADKSMQEAKKRWGGYERYLYWEVDGYGHGMPNKGPIELLEKVADFERNAHPDTVVWQPDLGWKRQFYWLYWEEPRRRALVHARLDRKANSIAVTVDADARGLCMLLSDELVDMGREVTVSLNDAVVFKGIPKRDFATYVMTASAGDGGRAYSARIPLVP